MAHFSKDGRITLTCCQEEIPPSTSHLQSNSLSKKRYGSQGYLLKWLFCYVPYGVDLKQTRPTTLEVGMAMVIGIQQPALLREANGLAGPKFCESAAYDKANESRAV